MKPSPETEAKTLAVRKQRAAEASRPRGMKAQAKFAKLNAKMKKGQARPPPRVLKRSKTVKHAMELLDDTFTFVRQRPPLMRTFMDDPSTAFLLDVYENVAKWPESVMKQFLAELTDLPIPEDVSGKIGDIKRVVHEVFDNKGLHTGQPYLARWRMWPHRSDKPEQVVPKEEKENLMASKMATKKKVASVKKPAAAAAIKAEKKANGVERKKIADDQKFFPGKKEPAKGIFADLVAQIPKTGITIDALAAKVAKSVDHPKAKNAAWVRRYAAGAVRNGFAEVK